MAICGYEREHACSLALQLNNGNDCKSMSECVRASATLAVCSTIYNGSFTYCYQMNLWDQLKKEYMN